MKKRFLMNRDSLLMSILILLLYTWIVFELIIVNHGNNSISTFAFYLLIGLSVFLKPKYILIEFVLIAPLAELFKLPNSYTAAPFLSIIIVLKLLFNSDKRVNHNDFSYVLVYLLLFFFSIIASLLEFQSVVPCIPFFVYLIMIYLCTHRLEITNKLYIIMARCFVVSCLIVCFGSVFFPTAVKLLSNVGMYTIRNTGFSNVWDFGQNLVIAISMVLIGFKNKRINLILAIMLNIVFIYFIIDTGLYTGLIGIVFVYSMYFFIDDRFSKIFKIFLYLFLGPLVIFLLYKFVFLKMNDSRGQFSDNGRFEIWKLYYQILTNNVRILLIGTGGGTIMSYANKYNILTTHNVIIEKIMEFGIIGCTFLVLNIKKIYENSITSLRNNPKLILPIVYLLMGLFQGVSGSEILVLLIILSYQKKNSVISAN